jgi:hypothetical protein
MADVAVNNASTTEVGVSDPVAAGRSSRADPIMIAAAKLNATTRTGVRVARAARRRRSAGPVDGAVRSVTPSNSRPVAADYTAGLEGAAWQPGAPAAIFAGFGMGMHRIPTGPVAR